MARNYEMDMTSGPLLGKILAFSFPLMCSGVLQLLFNAADIIVVGRYAGHTALAAVGSTSSLINLLVNLFVGLSVGANVLIARSYGAGRMEAVHKGVHTAMLTALVGGIALIFVGLAASRPMLSLMGTPDDVIDQAALYLRIYFVGAPSLLVYNFGAAILRAVGDTRRPLYFLTLAGVLNVILNLVFVIVFSMGVAGVALATILSQTLSAWLIVLCLMHNTGAFQLVLQELRIDKEQFQEILRIGVPAGIQGMVFSLSNVVIQSSVNSFGSAPGRKRIPSVCFVGARAPEFCEPKRGCQTFRPGGSGGSALYAAVRRRRHPAGQQCLSAGSLAAGHLHPGTAGYYLRAVPDERGLHYLFSLRLDGLSCLQCTGPGFFHAAYDRIHPGRLCTTYYLGHDPFPVGTHPAVSVPFVSGILGDHGGCASDLLPDPPPEDPHNAACCINYPESVTKEPAACKRQALSRQILMAEGDV